MRVLALAIVAAFAIGVAVPAMAQDTTVIKKDNGSYGNDHARSKVIIKKKQEPESKTVIHKNY